MNRTLEPAPIRDLVHVILQDEYTAAGPKPTATGTLLRVSQALACSRQIGFDAIGAPQTEVPGTVLLAFGVGNAFHERIQAMLRERWGAETEVPVDLRPTVDCSGSADAVYLHPEWGKTVVEIKTISGYGFKIACGEKRDERDAPGPKVEHLTQAGLYAHGLEADAVHIVYVDKDRQRFAEWVIDDFDGPLEFGYDKAAPVIDATLNDLITSEIARMNGIAGRISDGVLPARYIPGWGTVQDVPAPKSHDKPWNCRYCRYNALCAALPPSPTPLPAALEPAELPA